MKEENGGDIMTIEVQEEVEESKEDEVSVEESKINQDVMFTSPLIIPGTIQAERAVSQDSFLSQSPQHEAISKSKIEDED